ncbi:MAG: hypothetical protein LBU87_05515 [Lactobacillales bacterium]|jgi:hypothetical protein|nr:hypothetical protein [Lactobacillales bacterium]
MTSHAFDDFKANRYFLDAIKRSYPMTSVKINLDEFVRQGFNLAHCNYCLFREIIQLQAPFEKRAEMMTLLINHPSFKCDPDENPRGLVLSLALSTYDRRCQMNPPFAYKYELNERLDADDTATILTIRLGLLLKEKGFDLSYKSIEVKDIFSELTYKYLKLCNLREKYLKMRDQRKLIASNNPFSPRHDFFKDY